MRKTLIIAALGAALFAAEGNAAGNGGVSMRAVSRSVAGGIRYSYTVTNGSDKNIVTVIVGLDFDEGTAHLSEQPVGWKSWREERIGYGNKISPTAASAPPQWIALGMLFEESDQIAISWIVSDNAAPAIAPGAIVSGFAITVGKQDAAYASGAFTAIFDDGTTTSGRIHIEQ